MTLRSFLKKTAVVAASTLLALAGVEVAVRAMGVAPDIGRLDIHAPWGTFMAADNPILKYVPRPGSGDINRSGYRDHEYPLNKPPGVFRIVVIGDSIAFGFCDNGLAPIPINGLFSKVLERSLNDAHLGETRFEVINLGVSGYDSRQEVEFLKTRGLALAPDLVVVAYCLNDREDGSVEVNALRSRGWNRMASTALFRHSALVRYLWQRLPWLFGGPQRYQKRDNRVEIAFDELRALADEHRFSVVVAVFPWLMDFKQYPRSQWPEEHRYAAAVSSRYRFPVLDLLSTYETRDLQSIELPCRTPHPNLAGHALAAQAIQEFLIGNRLLPGSR
jgi:hypothetical protein